MKKENGSIAVFTLVALLFMAAFLIISYANIINNSKSLKEQLSIIKGIYYKSNDSSSYTDVYTDLRRKNRQNLTAYSTNSNILKLEKTFKSKLINYKIYGNSVQNGTPSPDNSIEIQSVGDLVTDKNDVNYGKYKIPIKVSGKNVFNLSAWSTAVTNNGVTVQYLKNEDCFLINGTATVTTEVASKYINIPNEPNTYYALSTQYVSGNIDRTNGEGSKYAVAYFGNGDAINTTNNWMGIYLQNNNEILTRINNKSYVTRFWFYINKGVTFNNYKVKIQLEEGKNATDYEPYQETIKTNIYLNEPLRKVGDYADYIDFKNQKVVRNITAKTIDSITTYLPRKLSTVCWFTIGGSHNHIVDSNVLSPMFKSIQESWWSNEEGILSHKINSSGIYFALEWKRLGLTYDGENVYKTEDTTKSNPVTDTELYNLGKEYILSNFSENDRVIYYTMISQTEENIELSELPSFEDYTKIEIETETTASKIEVEYDGYTITE